jgi:hypothetical protein
MPVSGGNGNRSSDSATIAEVKAGLAAYRDDLVDTFRGREVVIPVADMQRELAARGFANRGPVVAIPYHVSALEQAMEVTDRHPWRDPFVSGHLTDALGKRRALDAGQSIYDVGFPTPFASTLLGAVFVFDDIAVNTREFEDPTFAKVMTGFTGAHEMTHGSLFALDRASFAVQGSGVDVTEHIMLGQPQVVTRLEPGGGTAQAYDPAWIDEAVADWGACAVRETLWPESMSTVTRRVGMPDVYGKAGAAIVLSPRYLLACTKYPDAPGVIGHLALAGLDALEAKRPGLIALISDVARGHTTVNVLHDALRNGVGTELTAAMIERRPYNTWAAVLDQVQALPRDVPWVEGRRAPTAASSRVIEA